MKKQYNLKNIFESRIDEETVEQTYRRVAVRDLKNTIKLCEVCLNYVNQGKYPILLNKSVEIKRVMSTMLPALEMLASNKEDVK